jgi:hypothetical protein
VAVFMSLTATTRKTVRVKFTIDAAHPLIK